MNWKNTSTELLLQMEAQFVELLNVPGETSVSRSALRTALDGTRAELDRRYRNGGKVEP